MPTPPHYSPLLFFSPCLVECIPHLVICRVTMWTSALDSSMSLVSGDVKINFVCLSSSCIYLSVTLLCFLSILVHDGGLELGSLLFDGDSVRNLWSVPSATWVDMPSFKLNASISCQHPHIIHRSYSSLHVWWSAFLTWWFVEWRCGQVPWIRLCLWWVEMSKINFVCLSSSCIYLSVTLLCFLSILVHDGGLELGSLLFDGDSVRNLWSVPFQRELKCQLWCWLLAFHANTPTLFTALILLSMSGGVHSSLGDL